MDQKSNKRKGNRNLKKESNLLRGFVKNTAASPEDIFEFCFDDWFRKINGFLRCQFQFSSCVEIDLKMINFDLKQH